MRQNLPLRSELNQADVCVVGQQFFNLRRHLTPKCSMGKDEWDSAFDQAFDEPIYDLRTTDGPADTAKANARFRAWQKSKVLANLT